ncbi:MAG: RNase adapter RapZ [Sterolibacterium sp.]|nr:RNase adapter RapZ [Sterolibacterium sp.]
MQIILISGLSGSGKSIALNVLEDASYFCVDNLPSPLLLPLVEQLRSEAQQRVAVAMDMRSGSSIAQLPQQMDELRQCGVEVRFIFLDAREDVLIQRFSETRRRHPLGIATTTLGEAIALERRGLEHLAELGHRIDTSALRPNVLRAFVRDFALLKPVDAADPTRSPASALPAPQLTLLFESFGFKHGLPLDVDLVFDVRCLPNPHYDPQLRPLDGRDPPVIDFLEAQPEVMRMLADIRQFIDSWLPCYVRDARSYLTVGIGCTGGQHRSVFLAERLAREFRDAAQVLVRHRAMTPRES